MQNPFPGMNPYLEPYWRDMHATLIVLMRQALNERLPDNLIARIEERVYVELPAAQPRGVYPDVRIIQHRRAATEPSTATTAVATRPSTRPILVEVQSEPITETYINIIETAGERVLVDALRAGLFVYSPHTALDAADGGINHWLAGLVGSGAGRPIIPHPNAQGLGVGHRVELHEPITFEKALIASGTSWSVSSRLRAVTTISSMP